MKLLAANNCYNSRNGTDYSIGQLILNKVTPEIVNLNNLCELDICENHKQFLSRKHKSLRQKMCAFESCDKLGETVKRVTFEVATAAYTDSGLHIHVGSSICSSHRKSLSKPQASTRVSAISTSGHVSHADKQTASLALSPPEGSASVVLLTEVSTQAVLPKVMSYLELSSPELSPSAVPLRDVSHTEVSLQKVSIPEVKFPEVLPPEVSPSAVPLQEVSPLAVSPLAVSPAAVSPSTVSPLAVSLLAVSPTAVPCSSVSHPTVEPSAVSTSALSPPVILTQATQSPIAVSLEYESAVSFPEESPPAVSFPVVSPSAESSSSVPPPAVVFPALAPPTVVSGVSPTGVSLPVQNKSTQTVINTPSKAQSNHLPVRQYSFLQGPEDGRLKRKCYNEALERLPKVSRNNSLGDSESSSPVNSQTLEMSQGSNYSVSSEVEADRNQEQFSQFLSCIALFDPVLGSSMSAPLDLNVNERTFTR